MEALPHLGARAQPRNPPILCKDAHLGRPGDVAEAAHHRGVGLFTLRPHELADRTDLVITSVDQCDVQAVARTAEGFRRAVAADGKDGIGEQALAARALKQRLQPAFRAERDGPIIGGSRRRIGARVALACGRHHGSRQRSHKSGDRGAPTPHPPPSRFPARDNIDPQYSAIVNMEEPLRTTSGQRMGGSQLLLHGPCGPSPTGSKITRIQGCRGASSLPRSPIRLPHNAACPREGEPMNRAAIIPEILRREGTQFLSCYPRNPLIEACAALDIRPILCRQERVGVGLADGYTRIKRGKRNGVFAAQAGPGIENAFPGVAQAFSENVPLLVIPAGLPLARQYVRPVFRAADVYRPVTKWSALAHSVQELPDLMRRAYHAMRSGKGGPVLIEIPAEVWEAEYEGELDYAAV